MEKYEIEGHRNESFTIKKIENMSHAPAFVDHLKAQNFDGNLYHMERVIEGTRKKPCVIVCFKAANHDTFVSMI